MTPGRARTRIEWRPVIWSGLIAGAIFLVLELIMVPLFLGMPPWAPVRMIAAIVLGRDVLPPPATFDIGIFLAAALVHFPLSIIYALIHALMLERWPMNTAMALLAGGVFGLVLYLVNFYGFTAVFPWFAEARNWVSILVHIAFGVVAAWAYGALRTRGAVPRAAETF